MVRTARQEATDKAILVAILPKKLPQNKTGDRQRVELSQNIHSQASLAQTAAICQEIAQQTVKVPKDEDRQLKVLTSLQWSLDHEASSEVRDSLRQVLKSLQLGGQESIRGFIYSQLVSGDYQYPAPGKKPGCTCQDDDEQGVEIDSKNYPYPYKGKPKVVPQSSYPQVGDSPGTGLKDIIRVLRLFIDAHPGSSLEQIFAAAREEV